VARNHLSTASRRRFSGIAHDIARHAQSGLSYLHPFVGFLTLRSNGTLASAATTYTLSQVGAATHIMMAGGAELVLANVALSSLSGDWIGV